VSSAIGSGGEGPRTDAGRGGGSDGGGGSGGGGGGGGAAAGTFAVDGAAATRRRKILSRARRRMRQTVPMTGRYRPQRCEVQPHRAAILAECHSPADESYPLWIAPMGRRTSPSAPAPQPAELVILIGPPGAGKTSFHRARFASTHVHVSKDRLRNRRDRQAAQLTLVDDALAAGRSVVVDNVNVTMADRAALIEVARRRGATIAGYLLDTAVGECAARNRTRSGRDRVPDVAIFAAAKRFEPPTLEEGFGALHTVRAADERFDVSPIAAPDTIFLLSPASTSGERAVVLLNERATFPLAARLRSQEGAPLGEVFSFLSSLYFRGKLTYAHAFGRPPATLCGAFVITPGEGLRDPAEPVTFARLRAYVDVRIKPTEPRYLEPLVRDAEALRRLSGDRCRVVLLGSIASARYVEPLLRIFGDRLLFPPAFVGRGDMSRGGLLLRCVAEGRELDYAPLEGAVRHGARPPRLPKLPRR
jgi:predicted kinase